MGTNEFGYVGASPTQSSSSNTGVFGSDDVYDLIDEGKWALQIVQNVSYLVIAGGGGGRGAASNDGGGGGGGAGGYRNSYASETSGANSSTETPIATLNKGVAYTITVGAGGSYGGDGNASSITGSDITDVTTVGGGKGGGGSAGTNNQGS